MIDLWAVARKPIVLAGNQSCSQSYELVKCVTCQGSLGGFSSLGLWIKTTSLERGPLLLWQRRSQTLKDLHLLPDPLYSHPPFFSSEEMRCFTGAKTGKSSFPRTRCVCSILSFQTDLWFFYCVINGMRGWYLEFWLTKLKTAQFCENTLDVISRSWICL